MKTNDPRNSSNNNFEEDEILTGNGPGDEEALEEDGTPVLDEEDLEENNLDEEEVEDVEWEEPEEEE